MPDEDLAHLSPTLHEHINPYGKYRFAVDRELSPTAPARPQPSPHPRLALDLVPLL